MRLLAAFLGQDTVVRISFKDSVNNYRFSTFVNLRDKVIPALAVERDILHTIKVSDDMIACGVGRADTDIQHWVHFYLRQE